MFQDIDNREVVLTAVAKNGLALQYASTELQQDSEIISATRTRKRSINETISDRHALNFFDSNEVPTDSTEALEPCQSKARK
jgi:hypothetical protein